MRSLLFPTIQDLAKSGFLFRIQDTGKAALDRYDIVFCDGACLSVSMTGAGVSMWCGSVDPLAIAEKAEDGAAVDLALGDLGDQLQCHILSRLNEVFEEILDGVERGDARYVAASRDQAEIHLGLIDSIGKGIYAGDAGAYYVRMEGSANEDRGPYATGREATLATLPDKYSLSGPEYHPEVDASSLQATPGIAARIEALGQKDA